MSVWSGVVPTQQPRWLLLLLALLAALVDPELPEIPGDNPDEILDPRD